MSGTAALVCVSVRRHRRHAHHHRCRTPRAGRGLLGAPLVAREFDTGTYQLAWTQSITRGQWITTKLALLATAVVAGWAALDGLMSWWLARSTPPSAVTSAAST
jgi:hypothetical protein